MAEGARMHTSRLSMRAIDVPVIALEEVAAVVKALTEEHLEDLVAHRPIPAGPMQRDKNMRQKNRKVSSDRQMERTHRK
jgi:hypothetical protein